MSIENKVLRWGSVFSERHVMLFIALSTIIDLAVTIYFLSQGTTIVFQNIYYFTIVLAAYWYKWRGVYFSSALSIVYLGLSILYDPHFNQVLQALIRTVIFILISIVVAYLSTRLEGEKKRYHTIFSKAESGMVAILSSNNQIKEANLRFQEITGEKVVHGEHLDRFLKPEAIAILSKFQEKVEDFADVEMKLTSRSGGDRTCLVSGSHLSPNELVISLLDVTERKRIEEALRESEQQFRDIFNNVNDAIYLYEIGPDFKPGAFIDVNETACSMLGYSREQLLRMKPDDFATYAPRPGMEEPSKQMIEKGMGRFEEEHRRCDGSNVPVENSAHMVKMSGRTVALAVVRDISDRKMAEEEHRLQEETMRLVVTSAPFPLLITNWDGSFIVDANSQAVSAFGLELGHGQNLAGIFYEAEQLEMIMDALSDTGSLDWMEVSLRGKDGERQWHMVSARTINYPGEERLLFATYNITERRRMEKALHEAHIKLGILNSITRHDILNQMTVLNGFIELGKLKEKDPQLRGYFEKMSRASDNVQKQIAFTKDYQDMGVKAPVWVSVGRQTADAFAMLHPMGVTLEDETGGVEVLADLLAEKVPYNLIDNSMRHGEHVSHIKISTEQVGDSMHVVYLDDGAGIDDKAREHLFEKGYGKNTGLGLFLTREILAITGIVIEENGHFGKGVRFEMIVPSGAWRRASA